MQTYLEQLEARATEIGASLESVCAKEGVAITTLQRWRHGHTTCREDTFRALFARMDKIGKSKAKSPEAAQRRLHSAGGNQPV